jgi:putative Mg2+ transporter-C (MgtC) family protein
VSSVPDISTLDLVGRIALAGALGGLIGFERELSDQPAGFRTHILVALGAALFTIVGAYGVQSFFDDGHSAATFDPTRVAAQVVTGIGFLGAGAIIQQGLNVRGLTTAASLWVTAAIGTAVGLGYWEGAVATVVIALAALYGLKRIEARLIQRLRRRRDEGQERLDL